MNALAAEERAQAGDREQAAAAQCFAMVAIVLAELAEVLEDAA